MSSSFLTMFVSRPANPTTTVTLETYKEALYNRDHPARYDFDIEQKIWIYTE